MNRNANEFASSNHMDYSYDMEGQLLTASGFEGSGTGTPRVHEQWGYKYDPAGNLLQRTNGTGAANQLVETFATNSLNQLVAMGRNSAFTAAGRASASATGVTVQHNGGSVVSATRYADGSFARQGITLANGNNTFVGVATDASSRSASQSVTLSLSTNLTFTYDARGNLSNDGKAKVRLQRPG
jgi:hypothetical protein